MMQIDDYQLHWLAGLLEAEGSFLKGPPSAPHQPRISLSMTDKDIIEKVSLLWGVKYHPSGKARCEEKRWTPAVAVSLKGSRAVALMERLWPLMGKQRQIQMDAALACYQVIPHPTTRLNEVVVTEIKRRLSEKVSAKTLALEYNVNLSTIYQIKSGTNWGWVK